MLLSGLIVGLVTFVVRLLLPSGAGKQRGSTDGAAPPSEVFWVGLGLIVVGLLFSAVMIGRALITHRLVIVSGRVEAPLSARQRRRVGRILRGRQPAAEPERVVVEAIATQRVQTFRALVPAYVGLGVFLVGTVVAFADLDLTLPLLFAGLGLLAALVLAIDTAVHVRPAFRFLAAER